MSRVTLGAAWTFELAGSDAALLLRALRGALRDDDDRADAKALADALTRQRAQAARSLNDSMVKNEAAMDGNR